ncbi:MAG: hypothetical protein ACI92S_005602, partial [Planctomycetaceae bacterium]
MHGVRFGTDLNAVFDAIDDGLEVPVARSLSLGRRPFDGSTRYRQPI